MVNKIVNIGLEKARKSGLAWLLQSKTTNYILARELSVTMCTIYHYISEYDKFKCRQKATFGQGYL